MRRAVVVAITAVLGWLLLSGLPSAVPGAEPSRRPCYDCHATAKAKYEKKAIVHAPVKTQDCESCHKRHGFAQKLVLAADYPKLCESCHKDVMQGEGANFDHLAVKNT
ncbi:MAG TPA: cytochrome c3 family protein, partial [Candidatus Eisenbacteria bacterium]|nr:cytochrome c3 family protein [Candidatus Eisenbacteria bacterium]